MKTKSLKLNATTNTGLQLNLEITMNEEGLTLDYRVLDKDGNQVNKISNSEDDPFLVIGAINRTVKTIVEVTDKYATPKEILD